MPPALTIRASGALVALELAHMTVCNFLSCLTTIGAPITLLRVAMAPQRILCDAKELSSLDMLKQRPVYVVLGRDARRLSRNVGWRSVRGVGVLHYRFHACMLQLGPTALHDREERLDLWPFFGIYAAWAGFVLYWLFTHGSSHWYLLQLATYALFAVHVRLYRELGLGGCAWCWMSRAWSKHCALGRHQLPEAHGRLGSLCTLHARRR